MNGNPNVPPSWSSPIVPRLTLWLVGINVAIFLLEIPAGILFGAAWFENLFGMFSLSRVGLEDQRYWQMVSYMFLHANLLHLTFNMLVLYFAGREVEAGLGRFNFLVIYFIGGILAGLAQVFLTGSGGPLVGASGGTFAVLLAFTRMVPNLPLLAFIVVIPVRMKAKFLGWGAMLSALLFMVTGFMPGIGHMAHFVGGLFGLLYTMGIEYLSRGPKRGDQVEMIRPHRPSPEGSSPEGREEIDRILDKISRHGMHTLTSEEKRTLMRGRNQILRRTYFNG